MTNIGSLLLSGKKFLKDKGILSYALDAELLLMHVLKKEKTYLYAHSNEKVDDIVQKAYFKLLRKRAKKEPVAYLTGEKEFYGEKFYVEKGVFCPRPETELLIDEARNIFKENQILSIYEIGCGTGIISITLARIFKNSIVYCCDINKKALKLTIKNADRFGVLHRMKIMEGAFFEPLGEERFDLVISNPPYLSLDDYLEAEPEVRKEPKRALMAREKGLGVIKRIIRQGKMFIKNCGYLILEIGHDQGKKILDYAKLNGFEGKISFDIAGFERVFVGSYNHKN
jgi:release factor glutamine methyltransferase